MYKIQCTQLTNKKLSVRVHKNYKYFASVASLPSWILRVHRDHRERIRILRKQQLRQRSDACSSIVLFAICPYPDNIFQPNSEMFRRRNRRIRIYNCWELPFPQHCFDKVFISLYLSSRNGQQCCKSSWFIKININVSLKKI